MSLNQVKDLKPFLKTLFPNKKIRNVEMKQLNAPGENYASIILAIDVTVEDEFSKQEVINIVGKILPPNEFMRKFMNVEVTVRNEVGFYDTIVPTLKQLQKELTGKESLDFFPKFYGYRLNLDPNSDIVDENSLILMENLKTAGYYLLDKNKGYDLEGSKFMVEQMADLHSAVIALKETKPEVFSKKLQPFFPEFVTFSVDNTNFATVDVVVNGITKILKEDEFCVFHMNKIQATIENCKKSLNLPKNSPEFHNYTFGSLVHNDLWVNNIMVKTKNGKIVDAKFLDWQLYEFGCVTQDLLFFLASAIQDEVFKNSFDDLVKFYYDCLISNLKSLKCDTKKFSFHILQEEFKEANSKIAFLYIMGALPSIFATGDQTLDIHDVSKETLMGQLDASEICKKRMWLFTKKLIQNGWM